MRLKLDVSTPALEVWAEAVRASALPVLLLTASERGADQLALRLFFERGLAMELQSHGRLGEQEARLIEICEHCAEAKLRPGASCESCGLKSVSADHLDCGVSYLGQHSSLHPSYLVENRCERFGKRLEAVGIDPLTATIAGVEAIELFKQAILDVFNFSPIPSTLRSSPLP